jgi:spermidine synthase
MLTVKSASAPAAKNFWAAAILFALYFTSGFTALLYQVAWQRMLGLFSGSDVRSVTIIIASYLLGLGLGNLIGGSTSDRISDRQCILVYGLCNLGIATFAIASRFIFYDLLFLKLQYLAQSLTVMLAIVFLSLLIPTVLMGISLPILSKAINRSAEKAASLISWLYGLNTLGSGLGTLVSGWYIIGTLGYEKTVYLGAAFSATVGVLALIVASQFKNQSPRANQNTSKVELSSSKQRSIREWYLLVFLSGFAAISWEILWFRVLDIALQSNAYTYGHLLAFVLISGALGSMVGAKAIEYIHEIKVSPFPSWRGFSGHPKKVFLLIQGIIALYSAIAIWAISLYWQVHPHLRADGGFINPDHLRAEVIFKYLIVPGVITILPSFLMGFYFPLVQKAVQVDDRTIGRRVGLIVLANILGNTIGSLLTGLVLIDWLGTAGSSRLLVCLGLGFLLATRPNFIRAKLASVLIIASVITIVLFPNNNRLWAALHAIDPQAYFIVAEDATSVAAIAENKGKGLLFASGQVQAHLPYLHLHGLLGSVPALLHPNPKQVMIIGLGSGGTPHTIGVNPLTEQVRIIELLGAELTVLQEYAKTAVGKPLKYLFQDPRYQIIVGDGRRELVLSQQKFDIIEADAIQPWRSRAGMLYSQEFFQEVRSHLKPGGFFVQWDVGSGAQATMSSVFPYITRVGFGKALWILIGSDRPVPFERDRLLTQLEQPKVINFLGQAGIDPVAVAKSVRNANARMYKVKKDSQPQPFNTDLFPRGEYYLNQR